MKHKDCGDVTGQALFSWLDGRAQPTRPFFAFLNYMEAHVPRSPSIAARKQVSSPRRILSSLAVDAEPVRQFLHMFGYRRYSVGELRSLGDVYDATLVDLDLATGRLFASLRERGLLDTTVVIVTSDHGEGLGEHGQLDHKYNLYDPLIRVPLVVRHPGPGNPRGRISDPVSTRDIYPTVLQLAGLPMAAAPAASTPLPIDTTALATPPAAYAEMIAPVVAALKRISKANSIGRRGLAG